VLAVILTIWHHRAESKGIHSLPERAVGYVLLPLEGTITSAWHEVSLTSKGLFHGRQLARRVEQLERENLALENWRLLRQRESGEYQAILQQLGFKAHQPLTYIPARVVGWSGSRFIKRTIDIAAAGGEQVPEGAAVRTELGLVGRVMSSGAGRTTVMLLVDPAAGAAAVVPSTGATGVVMGPDPAGSDPDLLRLRYLGPDDTVAVGDKVFTSPVGDLYPSGIPIGVVEEVISGAGRAEPKAALVQPYAEFDKLGFVKVILWEK